MFGVTIHGDDDARIGVLWPEHAILGLSLWCASRVGLHRIEHVQIRAALDKVTITIPTKGSFTQKRHLQAVEFSACVRIMVRVRAPTSHSAFHMTILIFIDLALM